VAVPLAGNGVSPQSSARHSVSLTWDGGGAQVAGYNVYRSGAAGGSYSKINASTVTANGYSDNAVTSGTTYYYTVTAIDTNGAESRYSDQAAVTVPNP
jgi:fibronectin type 3 domain-containing protein